MEFYIVIILVVSGIFILVGFSSSVIWCIEAFFPDNIAQNQVSENQNDGDEQEEQPKFELEKFKKAAKQLFGLAGFDELDCSILSGGTLTDCVQQLATGFDNDGYDDYTTLLQQCRADAVGVVAGQRVAYVAEISQRGLWELMEGEGKNNFEDIVHVITKQIDGDFRARRLCFLGCATGREAQYKSGDGIIVFSIFTYRQHYKIAEVDQTTPKKKKQKKQKKQKNDLDFY